MLVKRVLAGVEESPGHACGSNTQREDKKGFVWYSEGMEGDIVQRQKKLQKCPKRKKSYRGDNAEDDRKRQQGVLSRILISLTSKTGRTRNSWRSPFLGSSDHAIKSYPWIILNLAFLRPVLAQRLGNGR
jgi:hypothetical protein